MAEENIKIVIEFETKVEEEKKKEEKQPEEKLTQLDEEEEIKDTVEDTLKEKEKKIIEGQEKNSKEAKKQKEIKNTKDVVDRFESGNVGDIQKFSSQQFGNVKQMATNPVQFIFGTVIKKMGKFARFGAFAFFAFLIDQAVKFVLNELMQPGRLLDRRFKLLADKQILLFTERKEQQELRQGFKTLIVSTIPGLRGLGIGGQISGNLYTGLDKIPLSGIDPRLIIPQKIKTFDHRQKFGSHTRGARGINS